MESILENGSEGHKKLVADVLLSDPWGFATHKSLNRLLGHRCQ